jgi:hypothetical protein
MGNCSLSVDVRKIPIDDLLKLGGNRILLPITLDRGGTALLKLFPIKRGLFISAVIPILNLSKTCSTFRCHGCATENSGLSLVDGDSMPPNKSGFFTVGRYVGKLGDVMDGKTYILLTKNEGIVYKRLNKNGKNALVLHLDNTYYKSYEVKALEILEIW